jgi:hypothetical protein
MPGKSGHGKGKHPRRSKKSKARQRHAIMALQQQAVAETPKPTATVGARPPTSTTASPAARASQHPYITTELRRISILAGIILVILILLALVLS